VGLIAPGMPRVMQRSKVLRSSQLSVPRPFAPAPRNAGRFASSAARSLAASVSDGTRTSGGSTTRDVRGVVTLVPRSHQKSLYARSTSPRVPLLRPSSPLCSCARFSSAATSSLVKNSLPSTLAGRSNGVIVRFEYCPCRSGSPQGVRGIVHFFAGVALSPAGGTRGAWAKAKRGDSVATVIAMVKNLVFIPASFLPCRETREEALMMRFIVHPSASDEPTQRARITVSAPHRLCQLGAATL